MTQQVRLRLPWSPELLITATLNWRSPTHDWCHVKHPAYINGISLPFSKVKVL